jgi:hypothetical protein
MMGRLERDQGQLFYSFCLEEVVPDDYQVRARFQRCLICGGSMASFRPIIRRSAVPRSIRF